MFGVFLPPSEIVVLPESLVCGVYAEEFITCEGCREGSLRGSLALTFSCSYQLMGTAKK